MAATPSLGYRAVLAIGLFIGFYLIALLIAGILVAIPIVEYQATHHVILKLALFCFIGAIVILWSIIPRPDRFVVPGPELSADTCPDLFRLISDAAGATRQPVPKNVYLLLETNAFVSFRGGIMGLGSKPVMGIGLPLIGNLSVSQLQSVIIHEFGHFVGGDLKLGPWIYKTRAAIGRTIEALGQHSGFLQRPFVWYGNYFLKITHGISRQQEYFADSVSAGIIGKQSCIDALKKITAIAPFYDHFWAQEISPVLSKGYAPPIMKGFAHFLGTPKIHEALDTMSKEVLAEEESDPYDTHPSLKNRIEALNKLEFQQNTIDNRPAEVLVGDMAKMEENIIGWLNANSEKQIKPLRWEDTGSAVWLEYWKESEKPVKELPVHAKIKDIPDLIANKELFPSCTTSEIEGMSAEDFQKAKIIQILAPVLAVALHGNGWKIRSFPGEEVIFMRGNSSLTPFSLTADLVHGKLNAGQWSIMCQEQGIGELQLVNPS